MYKFFKQLGLSDNKKVRFAKMKHWNNIDNLCLRLYKATITDWEEMNEKLIEEYLPQSY
jgi:hypothetical protein